jgi:hypothetical protein
MANLQISFIFLPDMIIIQMPILEAIHDEC